jgi:hypothetical protein
MYMYSFKDYQSFQTGFLTLNSRLDEPFMI